MFKEYLKRLIVCILGLILFGFGNFFGVMAGSAGTNAWNTLALGVSGISGISFGMAVFLISLVIIVIDVIGKGKLGFGTIFNVILISLFSDIFLDILNFVPVPSNAFTGAVFTMIGQIIISFATILYMKPALGCGPRDALMIIIGRKFPEVPIGIVKFFIEVLALVAGFMLGAPFGVGTVLVMVSQASIFQFVCRICKYDPRKIEHEDVIDTCKRIGGYWSEA